MDDEFKRAALDYMAGRMTPAVMHYLAMLEEPAQERDYLEVIEPEKLKPKLTLKELQSLGLLDSPVHQAWRKKSTPK